MLITSGSKKVNCVSNKQTESTYQIVCVISKKDTNLEELHQFFL